MSTVEPGTLCSHPPGERIIYCTVCKPSSTVLKRRVDELKTLLEAKGMRIAELEKAISSVLQTLFPCPERVTLQLALNPKMMHPPQELSND